MKNEDKLLNLYKECFGNAPERIERLAAAGGDREYYRLYGAGNFTCIGTVGDRLADAKAFVALSGAFEKEGIDVPHVYAVDDGGLCYLQQDLGQTSLFSLLGSEEWMPLAEKTVRLLAKMQTIDPAKWKPAVEYPALGKRQMMWDLNYFKYEYLLPQKAVFDESRLEDDFDRVADQLCSGDTPEGFMMRDCQSRNVMVSAGNPYFIDFQGGRRGPVIYDIVSFLWQARAALDAGTRMRLFAIWSEEICGRTGINKVILERSLYIFVLFRTLQVLGAYGFRGLIQRRAHFIESIPAALGNLRELIEEDSLWRGMPELKKVCEYITSHSPMPEKHEGLQIMVSSFSYKRGYPENLTGNGGGFMFDCRGMHNPGRYDEFKLLTGMDQPVIDFLENRGEVQLFVENAVKLVSPTVECYLRRGFSDLEVGFGCTGGRHRSVYCAEAFAKAIKDRYPKAEVMVSHREQGIKKILK